MTEITWENLSAELALAYLIRTMELDGEVLSHSNLKKRFSELRGHGARVFDVCVDILEDQGFLEDKIALDAERGGYCHLYYVYEPAEGYADAIVKKVNEMRSITWKPREPRLPVTASGCGKQLGQTDKTCGNDDFKCSNCLKDKK